VKAIVFDEFGGPEVLRYDDIVDPEPGFGEVVVDLHAAALNHVDIDIREGVSRFDFEMPHVLGIEGAGVISEVGAGVDASRVGERVAVSYIRTCGHCEWCLRGQDNLCSNRLLFGEHIRGTYAQRMLAPANHCLPLADNLAFADAAATMTAFGTAWHGLVTRSAAGSPRRRCRSARPPVPPSSAPPVRMPSSTGRPRTAPTTSSTTRTPT
jgi:D-arabinose 1-dehydrogenase-like Zn-dependent alcohol dehydrogenase